MKTPDKSSTEQLARLILDKTKANNFGFPKPNLAPNCPADLAWCVGLLLAGTKPYQGASPVHLVCCIATLSSMTAEMIGDSPLGNIADHLSSVASQLAKEMTMAGMAAGRNCSDSPSQTLLDSLGLDRDVLKESETP